MGEREESRIRAQRSDPRPSPWPDYRHSQAYRIKCPNQVAMPGFPLSPHQAEGLTEISRRLQPPGYHKQQSPPLPGRQTLPSPNQPLRTSSRRLWTAARIAALPAHGVRLQAPSLPAHSDGTSTPPSIPSVPSPARPESSCLAIFCAQFPIEYPVFAHQSLRTLVHFRLFSFVTSPHEELHQPEAIHRPMKKGDQASR